MALLGITAWIVGGLPADASVMKASWVETQFDAVVKKELCVTRGTRGEFGFLKLVLTSSDGSDVWTSSREESLTNKHFSDWRVATPIRVKGDIKPQVLAELSRPNWLDFQIYSLGDLEIRKVFTFSCRDERSMKWNSVKGQLTSFEVFDLFEHAPQSLEKRHKPGYRWRLHKWYSFDPKSRSWRARNKQWEQYRFGDSPPGTDLSADSKCSFRF